MYTVTLDVFSLGESTTQDGAEITAYTLSQKTYPHLDVKVYSPDRAALVCVYRAGVRFAK